MDLNSLARTLAERLLDEFYGECEYSADPWTCDKCSPSLKQAEAVIREAIDKTLELAMKAVDSNSVRTRCPRCELSLVDEECQMCGWKTPRAAIRSLKQSNSGRAEQEAGERR